MSLSSEVYGSFGKIIPKIFRSKSEKKKHPIFFSKTIYFQTHYLLSHFKNFELFRNKEDGKLAVELIFKNVFFFTYIKVLQNHTEFLDFEKLKTDKIIFSKIKCSSFGKALKT